MPCMRPSRIGRPILFLRPKGPDEQDVDAGDAHGGFSVLKRLGHAFDHPCIVGGDADDGTYAAAGDCGYGFVRLVV